MFKKNISLKNIHKYIVLALVLTSITFLSIDALALSYTPARPQGPQSGIINEEYSFRIVSSELGSKWIFDWGDGTFSPWITFDNTSIYNIQKHSYNNPGLYQIRIKYKNNYGEESRWSPPLNISIYSVDEDTNYEIIRRDNVDWWMDLYKEFINKYYYDPEIHPLFINDYTLEELIKLKLESELEGSIDVRKIGYENNTYYLVDTNNDGKIDKFYVLFQGNTLKPLDYHEGEKLIESLNRKITEEDIEKEETKPVSSVFTFPLWAVSIPLVVIIVVFFLLKTGVIYFYEEEYEEKEEL